MIYCIFKCIETDECDVKLIKGRLRLEYLHNPIK